MNGTQEEHMPCRGFCFLAGMSELFTGGAREHVVGGKLTSAKNVARARVKQLGLAL